MKLILSLIAFLPIADKYHALIAQALTLLIFGVLIYLMSKAFKVLSERFLIKKVFDKKGKWYEAFSKYNVFAAFGYLIAALIAKACVPMFFPADYPTLLNLVSKFLSIYNIICFIIILNSILNIIVVFHARNPNIPVKSTVQVIKLVLNLGALLIITAIFLGKEPLVLISALGLTASVFILVFKDTILNLTATYQLAFNQMLKVGDWIEVPKHGADGDVVDISLTTVRVQNWDKTYITFPTNDLMSSSFKNWRGMQESGGRRIKRAVNIDMQSVKFVTPEMLARLKKIELLHEYLEEKEKELADYNAKHNLKDNIINGRNLTNLGTFRAYCTAYVKSREFIDSSGKFTTMVRQLEPTEKGVPLEIYCFTATTEWVAYETYQSDIFDHLIAALAEFELKAFQNPTGGDFKTITKGN